eukprot:scpid11950/ scgid32267/ Spectrin alpha chain, brain; Fodrin alpha chain; Spectrin, non-erythroid alpha chain
MDLRSRSSVSMASLQGDGATGQAAVDAADVNSAEHIRDSRHTILDRWQALQEVAKTRRTRLDDSRKLQVFKRDVKQALVWIEDKMTFATDDSYLDPTNLPSKQQKQSAFEAEISAHIPEHESLVRVGHDLLEAKHYAAADVSQELDNMEEAWQALVEQTAERGRKLEEAVRLADALRQFQNRIHDLMSWLRHCSEEILSIELANNLTSAESVLETHQEQKGEIDTRQSVFEEVLAFGKNLVTSGHYASEEVQNTMQTLQAEREKILQTWQERKNEHTQCYELHLFVRDAQAADVWTSARSALLDNSEQDLGDSLDHAEALMKKHEDIETSLAAQEEKEKALQDYAQRLVTSGHYDSDGIAQRLDVVLEKRAKLKERSEKRRHMLEQSLQLQRFNRDVVEAEAWCAEKSQIATDESYRDPTNLQSKVQKQQAFDAEILANRSQIESVSSTAHELRNAGHYAADHIAESVESLADMYAALCEASKVKGQRLDEALKQQQWLRAIDDVSSWMETVETSLASEEQGKDLSAVNGLLKRHNLTEANILENRERVDNLIAEGQVLIDGGHFDSDGITHSSDALNARYEALSGPAQTRREKLEASQQLQLFLRDISDIELWLSEREPRAFSEDYGADLASVQSLQKQHEAFLLELTGHEGRIAAVGDLAQELVDVRHYATEQIIERWDNLQMTWEKLKDSSEQRADKLDQSLQSQRYYVDASDAETWIELKRVFVAGGGLGKDEDATEQLLKSTASTESDLEVFRQDTLLQLQTQVNAIVARNHFELETVELRQAEIAQQCTDLQVLLKTKHRDLTFALEMHQFLRQANTMEQWISEKSAIAGNEDLGRDVEHVQHLREHFDTFAQSMLPVGADRLQAVMAAGKVLLAAEERDQDSQADPNSDHPILEAAQQIVSTQDSLNESWEQLQETVSERRAHLAAAEQIHIFARDAAEAREWISEKDAQLTDDYGKDVGSAENLQRQHEAFERDLEAVQTRVEDLTGSADRLATQYPDYANVIDEQQQAMTVSWGELNSRTLQRRERLSDSLELYHFLSDVVGLMSWMEDMMHLLSTNETIHDVASAEAALQLHDDHRRAIEAREDNVVKGTEFGQGLVDRGHFACEQVQDRLENLHTAWEEIHQFWQERKQTLDWALEAQQFDREAERLESWLAFNESRVTDDDIVAIADSTASQTIGDVETLLKQHGDLEKMLEVQEERLHNFNDHAERLVSVPSTADGEDDGGEAGSAAAIGEA